MLPFTCILLSQEPSLSGVGMATLSTRTMDVLDFVGVVDVPAIVSVVDEHFYYYRHIYYPSVTGVTQFLTDTLPKSTFTAVSGAVGATLLPLLLMTCAVCHNEPSNYMTFIGPSNCSTVSTHHSSCLAYQLSNCTVHRAFKLYNMTHI